jgi:hypothetical protein
MANEFVHGSVGTELTQAEWEGVGTHVFNSQATGDIPYASSSSQLSRLAIGTINRILTSSGSVPQWSASLSLTGTLTVGVDDTGYDVKFFGATAGSYWQWDESADGVVQIGTLTVGVDDAGHDVKFFGNTASAYMLWDASADDLILAGTAQLSIDTTTDATNTTSGSFHTDGGAGIAKKLYVGTDLDVDGTSNLDAVDIDGAVQIDGTVTVGVDDAGLDVKFFGDTASRYWMWDTSADGVLQIGTLTVGVDDAGHDVKFFGATASSYMLWDESADALYLVKSKLNVSADTFSYIYNSAYGTGPFPVQYLRQARGTEASPTATQDNDELGLVGFQAYGASGFRNSAYIYGRAAENATDSTSAADLEFWTTPTGSVSPVLRLTIDTTGDVDIHSGDLLNVGAAGNDWTTNALTLAGGSSSQKIKTETTGSGVNADFEAKIPASATGNASMIFTQGSGDGSANNQEFRFAYQASVGYFRFRNEQLGADVWRNSDGDATMDCNSTWDDNAFDDEDDAMVLYRAFGVEHKQLVYEQGKQMLRSNFEELISLGILRRYDDGWVGYNDQRMAPLLAGGIYQNRFRMDKQFEELDARIKKLEKE